MRRFATPCYICCSLDCTCTAYPLELAAESIAMADAGTPVKLYVYDLSQGLARSLSAGLLGIQLDAIYHTGIVIDGVEYYFGQGIQQDPAGRTPFGQPMQVIELGTTFVPPEVREEFMMELSERYRPDSYSLLRNNCNHFSNELSQLLTGNGIPEHIVSLPDRVLSTPLGMMLAPMLGSMEERMKALSAQGHAFQPQYHTPAQTASVPQVVADTPAAASPSGIDNSIRSFADLALQQQQQQQQKTDGVGSHVPAASQRGSLLGAADMHAAATERAVTNAEEPVPKLTQTDSSAAAPAQEGPASLKEQHGAAGGAVKDNHTAASSLAQGSRPVVGRAAAQGLCNDSDSGLEVNGNSTNQQQQAAGKAEFEAAVRQHFAALMSEGGRSANEAAALAVQKALQKVKVQS